MKEAGYLELVLYGRRRLGEGFDDPEKDLGDEEIRKLISSLKQDSPEFKRLSLMSKAFSLTKLEEYIVFISFLPYLETAFKDVFNSLGSPDGRPCISMIIDMWDEREESTFRYDFLKRFFIFEKDELIYLKPHVKNFLLGLLKEEPEEAKKAFYETSCIREILEKYNGKGRYFFYGPKGSGRKYAFLRMSDKLSIKPLWIEKEKLEEQLFFASLSNMSVGFYGKDLWTEERACDYEKFLKLVVIADEEPESWEGFYEFTPVQFKEMGMEERFCFWNVLQKSQNEDTFIDYRKISNLYNLTPGEIITAFEFAKKLNFEKISEESIIKAVGMVRKTDFSGFAEKIESSFTYDDLVLPLNQKEKLKEACKQVIYRHKVLEQWEMGKTMSYGTGVTMIFAGPPGTGKTMAAQVLANELKMELRKIDLASVVSKYVGETEKNLKAIFKDASRCRSVLFFDEADVLFSKRTDVKDSGDKYSNMESAFLLQEMERYEGVAILATNFIKNMDEAFKRRMRFIVEFPFPGEKERLSIWKKAIPQKLPRDEKLDLEFLAKQFELSGSGIKNAIYQGAFLSAAEDKPLGMKEILKAVYREFEKSGKLLSKEDFGIYEDLLEE